MNNIESNHQNEERGFKAEKSVSDYLAEFLEPFKKSTDKDVLEIRKKILASYSEKRSRYPEALRKPFMQKNQGGEKK